MINLEISRTIKFIKVTGNKGKMNRGWGLTVKWRKRTLCGEGVLFFYLDVVVVHRLHTSANFQNCVT